MDLRELRYFVQVAELKSFSKAAIHLRIAQPALSRQVRKLEGELGVELLIRSGRGLQLTDAGAKLLKQAYHVLDQVEDLKTSVKAQGTRVSGSICLGVPPAAGEMLVPSLLGRCRELYPDLEIDVVEGFSGFLYERLLGHELSLAVMHNPPAHRDLEILPLLIEDIYLVGPASPGRGLVPVGEIASLEDVPLILPHRPHSLRLLIESMMAERGLRMNLRARIDGLGIIRAAVRASLGYTALTYGSVHRDVQAGHLAAALLCDPRITWRLCLVRRNEPHQVQALDAVTAALQDEVETLVASGIWRGNPQIPARRPAAP